MNQNQYVDHRIKFAVKRVKAIRDRVQDDFKQRGLNIDFKDDNSVLRVFASMWLDASKQSGNSQADGYMKYIAIFHAMCILDGVFDNKAS
jgi:hypothetical protein